MALKAGEVAPDFTLPSTAGGTLTLSSLRGRKVVLYFYPKDQTPGCTREACDFRDLFPQVRAADAAVLGVSRDTLASHQRFREKERLPFELLTDEDAAVSMKYGVWGEKLFYGKPTVGMIRSTFLINEKGVIERAWSPVKVDGHAREVVAAVQGRTDVPRAPILAPAPSADDRPSAAAKRALVKKPVEAPAKPAPAKKPAAAPKKATPAKKPVAAAKKPVAAAKKPVAAAKKPVAKKR